MKITIEVANSIELEQIMLICQSLHISDVNVNIPQSASKPVPIIERGDKSINPTALFGIWKDNPRTLEGIRSTAWRKVPNGKTIEGVDKDSLNNHQALTKKATIQRKNKIQL